MEFTGRILNLRELLWPSRTNPGTNLAMPGSLVLTETETEPPKELNPRWFTKEGVASKELLTAARTVAEVTGNFSLLRPMLGEFRVVDTFVVGGQANGKPRGDLDFYVQLVAGKGGTESALIPGSLVAGGVGDVLRRKVNRIPEGIDTNDWIEEVGKPNFIDVFVGTYPPGIPSNPRSYAISSNHWITSVPGQNNYGKY